LSDGKPLSFDTDQVVTVHASDCCFSPWTFPR